MSETHGRIHVEEDRGDRPLRLRLAHESGMHDDTVYPGCPLCHDALDELGKGIESVVRERDAVQAEAHALRAELGAVRERLAAAETTFALLDCRDCQVIVCSKHEPLRRLAEYLATKEER